MSTRWQLAGYQVLEIVGFGGSGEVWRARADDTGDIVAVKRLRSAHSGPDGVARERLRREAAVLSSVAGEHVVRVRDVVLTETEAVLVMDYAAGGNLATVLAVRGPLPAPEVVTLVAPLAGALADAHERGIVHGDVTPANIVFSGDGRPLLTDFGVARAVGTTSSVVEGTPGYVAPEVVAGQPAGPAADVYALCRVAAEALHRDGAPEELVKAVEAGHAADPHDRPDARRLATDVLRSCAAAPVGLVRAVPSPPPVVTHQVRVSATPAAAPAPPAAVPARGRRRSRARRFRLPPRLVVSAVAAGVLVLAAAGGVIWGHRTQSSAAVLPDAPAPAPVLASPSASASATAEAAPDWRAILQQLDARRVRALTTRDAALLSQVYTAGSRAFAADAAVVRTLLARQLHPIGLAISTMRVQPVVELASEATLRVTDAVSAYTLVGEDSGVVRIAATRPRTFAMVLRRVAGGWRIQDINR